jgi:hypothetical protein
MRYQIKDSEYGGHEIHKAGCRDLKKDALQVSSVFDANSPAEVYERDHQEYEEPADYPIMPCAK